MKELLHVINELLRTMRLILEKGFELGIELLEFLWSSSVSLPGPALGGLTVAAFLVGLLVGRISKRFVGGVHGTMDVEATGNDRVVLDLARLRPLGLSAEEEVENEAMDITDLRRDVTGEGVPKSEMSDGSAHGSLPKR